VTRVVWTLQAIRDVDAIRGYIAEDSPKRAREFASQLVESAEQLADFPESGWEPPRVRSDRIREIFVGRYRIVYELRPDRLTILSVIHTARRFPPVYWDDE